MKKVFYLCVEAKSGWWTPGKEYAASGSFVWDESGHGWAVALLDRGLPRTAAFRKIERETFQMHNQEWFRHTPGEPMPCDGEYCVYFLTKWGMQYGPSKAGRLSWGAESSITGWRCAEQAESFAVAGDTGIPAPECSGAYTQTGVPMLGEGAQSNAEAYVGRAVGEEVVVYQYSDETPGQFQGNVISIDWAENVEMKQADLAAVTDHGHLSPGQRKYIDAMEAKQAAKESDAAEREQANLAERGKALESAAQAMDSVRDVHGHRLGWMA